MLQHDWGGYVHFVTGIAQIFVEHILVKSALIVVYITREQPLVLYCFKPNFNHQGYYNPCVQKNQVLALYLQKNIQATGLNLVATNPQKVVR